MRSELDSLITGSSEHETFTVRPLEATNGVHWLTGNSDGAAGSAGRRGAKDLDPAASSGEAANRIAGPSRSSPSPSDPTKLRDSPVSGSSPAPAANSTLWPTISLFETRVTSCSRRSRSRTSPTK